MTDEKKPAEEEQAAADEERVPDPGPAPAVEREPLPPEPTEEEAEQAAKEQAEAEDAARKAAEDQPEDPSVEKKARASVLVLKEQFDAEWPTVEAQFPGVEPEFGKEEDGYVELLNVQAPSMAYATSCAPPVQVRTKAERTQHGWDDFVDNSHPDAQADEDGDIEAKPKRRRQQKVTAGS
jgi:hypothetical protein